MSPLPPYPLARTLIDRAAYRLLPRGVYAKRELRREEQAYADLLRQLGVQPDPVELGPAPDGRVASLTWGSFTRADSSDLETLRFFTLGYSLMNHFVRALEAAPLKLCEVRSFFELGCGTGRLIRLLRGIDGLRLVGSDIDPETVAWCHEHVPGPEYHVNASVPPLAFAGDAEFDVVLAAAMFSCIPPADQDCWLEELHRVVRPGGIALCTVLADKAAGNHLGAEEQAIVDREGELVLSADHPKASATAKLSGTVDVYLSRSRVDALFGAHFEIANRQAMSNQELLVLRRT